MALNPCVIPSPTWYDNPLWTSSAGEAPFCVPTTGYYTTAIVTGQQYGDLSGCKAVCDSQSPSCKAYIATQSFLGGAVDLNCLLYTSQVPPPVHCPGFPPDPRIAAYRDDVRSCFSQSLTDAVKFCSYVQNRPNPRTITDYTSTTIPVVTTTIVSQVTKSVCVVPGTRRAIFEVDSIPTPEPQAATNAAYMPQPTIAPIIMKLDRRADSAAPPSCLETSAYPSWNFDAACSCLSTISELTVQGLSTASITTKIISRTTTVRVQKSSVPTFRPMANVPGTALSGGGQFNLISRVVKDSSNVDRRILMYVKPNRLTGENAAMHVSTDNKMFAITVDKNNLKSYGQLAFVTLKGGLNVIGELGDRGGGVGNEFGNCVAAQGAGPLTCTHTTGENAVFYEALIPGTKNNYAVGVAKSAPVGAKVLTLTPTSWGTVIVGCGTGGK